MKCVERTFGPQCTACCCGIGGSRPHVHSVQPHWQVVCLYGLPLTRPINNPLLALFRTYKKLRSKQITGVHLHRAKRSPQRREGRASTRHRASSQPVRPAHVWCWCVCVCVCVCTVSVCVCVCVCGLSHWLSDVFDVLLYAPRAVIHLIGKAHYKFPSLLLLLLLLWGRPIFCQASRACFVFLLQQDVEEIMWFDFDLITLLS